MKRWKKLYLASVKTSKQKAGSIAFSQRFSVEFLLDFKNLHNFMFFWCMMLLLLCLKSIQLAATVANFVFSAIKGIWNKYRLWCESLFQSAQQISNDSNSFIFSTFVPLQSQWEISSFDFRLVTMLLFAYFISVEIQIEVWPIVLLIPNSIGFHSIIILTMVLLIYSTFEPKSVWIYK